MTTRLNVGIINYGIGNLRSLANALKNFDINFEIIHNPKEINKFDRTILPGVGSFSQAMNLIRKQGWENAINQYLFDNKNKILGICLGMQILGSIGFEFGETKGLNLIEGKIEFLKKIGCKKNLPHIGWNDVTIKKKNILMDKIPNNSNFYFVNSYVFNLKNKNHEIGETNYGINFTSVLNNKNIYGTQFHPEKSSKVGIQMLKNFIYA